MPLKIYLVIELFINNYRHSKRHYIKLGKVISGQQKRQPYTAALIIKSQVLGFSANRSFFSSNQTHL
jgi:hypothetical protein